MFFQHVLEENLLGHFCICSFTPSIEFDFSQGSLLKYLSYQVNFLFSKLVFLSVKNI